MKGYENGYTDPSPPWPPPKGREIECNDLNKLLKHFRVKEIVILKRYFVPNEDVHINQKNQFFTSGRAGWSER